MIKISEDQIVWYFFLWCPDQSPHQSPDPQICVLRPASDWVSSDLSNELPCFGASQLEGTRVSEDGEFMSCSQVTHEII